MTTFTLCEETEILELTTLLSTSWTFKAKNLLLIIFSMLSGLDLPSIIWNVWKVLFLALTSSQNSFAVLDNNLYLET